jgi:hypothetical protein
MTAVAAFAQGDPVNKSTDGLVGKWRSTEAVVEIRGNGKLTINDTEFVYKVKNGVITIANDEGVVAFPFVLKGDVLVVEVNEKEIVYKRVKPGSDNDGSGGMEAPAGERVIQEFVGKWCYLANLSGTSNYRSDRCFTLYANGTYEYSSEVSSSGSAGSSVGTQYDTGRWAATPTTLIAYSKSHGRIVYPIELRNHPKNNDPMIVVDGDAYVTVLQKRPW